eukprot:9502135-Pyramimonas_sp.AAC.2
MWIIRCGRLLFTYAGKGAGETKSKTGVLAPFKGDIDKHHGAVADATKNLTGMIQGTSTS